MDFQFQQDEEAFRNEIVDFVKQNLPQPYFCHLYDEGSSDELWGFSMFIAKKLARKKWLTLSWPVEFGGKGASHREATIFKEESGYWGIPATGMGGGGTGRVGPSLILFGSDEQKRKYLPLISEGSADGVWCTGYSEPNSGSDLANIETTACKKGGDYVINGHKTWIYCAHRARWMWCACRTDDTVKSNHKGISIIIVDLKSKGITITPHFNYVSSHMFNDIYLDNVRVPVSSLVGQENNGWTQMMAAASEEKSVSTVSMGTASRIFDELVYYAQEHDLLSNPSVRMNLADLAIDLESARMSVYESAWLKSSGRLNIREQSRDKAAIDQLCEKVSRIGADVLGAYSQIDTRQKTNKWTKLKGLVEHFYYYSLGGAITGGSTYVQKNIVGQVGLRLPKSY